VPQPAPAPVPEPAEVSPDTGSKETPACEGGQYLVKCGDTLFSIARHFRITLNQLFEGNPGLDPSTLKAGDILCITGCAQCAGATAAGKPVHRAPAVAASSSSSSSTEAQEPAAPACATGNPYTVQRGDSFYLISRRFQIPLADLLAANPGTAPDRLLVGQVLCLPEVKPSCPDGHTPHTVAQGETFVEILERSRISYSALVAANPTVNLAALTAGQVLCIPPEGSRGFCQATGLAPHVVAEGETPASIAGLYQTTAGALLIANPMLAPQDFAPGTIVCLPRGSVIGS